MLVQQPNKLLNNDLPEYIAAIDLGSNSFHMLVAKNEHGEVKIVDRLGEKVQLAAGLTISGEITNEAKFRALKCLERFAQRIDGLDSAAVQIVGTNALRAAKNKAEFLREAEAVIGYPIEIIAGREEARLIYLGVAHTLADDQGNRLVIDIGGGSTELIIGERFESKVLESLHIGCVTFRERYFPDGIITNRAFNQAVRHASQELINIKQQYTSLGWQQCVGASGSVKAIFSVIEYLGYGVDSIDFEMLIKLSEKMIELEHTKFLDGIGLKNDRASIFPSGLAILYACFEVLEIKKINFTQGALREGLLYDILGRIQHEDVRERSIFSLQTRYGVDVRQSEIVTKTVLYAYQQSCNQWGIKSAQNENLLVWASKIYEIGLAVAHSQYHRHSAYIIHYSDLPGFTRLTQQYLSVIVRTHRRKFADEPFIGMTEDEKLTLKKLCVIFRLAIVLTADRRAPETDFTLKIDDMTLHLEMGEKWPQDHPLNVANLEVEKEFLVKQNFTLNIN